LVITDTNTPCWKQMGGERRKAWWARPSSIVVGLGSALLLVLACFGWTIVVGYMTGDAMADCQGTFLERFDAGEVVAAERHWLPPHLDCTLRSPPTDETYVAERPDAPMFGVPAQLVVTALGVGGIGFLVRRRRRARDVHGIA
jgi:hypothetical protein